MADLNTCYYAFKLFPPRPSFPADITEAEAAILAEHIAYWTELLNAGTAVAFGPVADPEGVWGLAVVEAGPDTDINALREHDPSYPTWTGRSRRDLPNAQRLRASAPTNRPRPRCRRSSAVGRIVGHHSIGRETTMDTTGLRAAYKSFLAVARTERFSAPPPPEWTAAQLLAHIVAGDTAITAVALAVAAGERPSYDNRPSLDRWNLARICGAAGDLPALIDLVEQRGQLLCRVAEQLTDAEADVAVATLIISNDEVMLDSPLPLRGLIDGLGQVHLPRHAEQLAALAV